MEQFEIREILQRAEEIEAQKSLPVQGVATETQIIEAAIEAGLSRESITQAIQERISCESLPISVGDFVFCQSTDGNSYVAKVTSIEEAGISVTFVRGSSHRAKPGEVKPLSLLPGQTVNALWPSWGWANAKVVRFDKELNAVHLQDWTGTDLNVSLDGIRICPTERTANIKTQLVGSTLAIAALGGGAIGGLIMWLLMR